MEWNGNLAGEYFIFDKVPIGWYFFVIRYSSSWESGFSFPIRKFYYFPSILLQVIELSGNEFQLYNKRQQNFDLFLSKKKLNILKMLCVVCRTNKKNLRKNLEEKYCAGFII